MSSLYCTLMSDTVGVLYRAASGTVDPWTKNQIVCNETQSLIAAGASPSDAAMQAQNDATGTLTTNPGGGADPSQFWCGLKKSASSAFDLTGNLGKTILFVGIGAVLLIFAFNYFTRRQ
jgi:hypothetical protein